jgi:hypothetical protein
MGHEEDELKPYVEPEPDYKDLKRIGMHSSSLCSSSLKRVYIIFLITCAWAIQFAAYLCAFLGMFATLQNPLLSSPSRSVCTHESTREPLDRFLLNLVVETLGKLSNYITFHLDETVLTVTLLDDVHAFMCILSIIS